MTSNRLAEARFVPEGLKRLYDQRMERLAVVPPETGAEPLAAILLFRLETERYAMALTDLQEVLPFDGWTPLPTAPSELLGVINVRGDIRPVLSLKRLLGLPVTGDEKDGYILVLKGESGAAVRVDEILQVCARVEERAILVNTKMILGWGLTNKGEHNA